MGIDIHGHVEWRPDESHQRWFSIITYLPVPKADIVDFLFGVDKPTTFDPIAERRGIPEDASSETKAAAPDSDSTYAFGQSYITLEELKEIDWVKMAQLTEGETYFYDTEGVYVAKLSPESVLTDIEFEEDTETLVDALREVGEVSGTLDQRLMNSSPGDILVMKREPIHPKHTVMTPAWDALLNMMSEAGRIFGNQNVRLVVWFSA